MTEKRFTYSKKPHYYGNVIDNGRMLGYADVVDLLNELNDENNHIKQTIQEAYNNERTAIGKNVLKQLLQSLE